MVYKRNDADFKKVHSKDHIGFVCGADLQFLKDKLRLNIEGRFFDETAFSVNVSYVF